MKNDKAADKKPANHAKGDKEKDTKANAKDDKKKPNPPAKKGHYTLNY